MHPGSPWWPPNRTPDWTSLLPCGDHDRMTEETRNPTEDVNARYRVVGEPPMRRAEVRVIGSDYGATSYTTKEQADRLVGLLGLESGMLLLDVGSGAGWPGIYLAHSTGCRVVLSDVALEGLATATRRIQQDGEDGSVIATSGDSLALSDGLFDAATSSDVLC